MQEENIIKDSFERVKKDIFTLGSELTTIKNQLSDLRNTISGFNRVVNQLKIQQLQSMDQHIKQYHTLKPQNLQQNPQIRPIIPKRPIMQQRTSTHNLQTSTHPVTSTHTSTVPLEVEGSKYPNFNSSIGNRGASTDRQTDNQTDNSTHFTQDLHRLEPKTVDQSIHEASEMLADLDTLKKQIRIKFKAMTTQEMLVFSTIYQLEEQTHEYVGYRQIALNLGLSQSSIRDYVQRMINKGIPILKTKLNNKKIVLSVSSCILNLGLVSILNPK